QSWAGGGDGVKMYAYRDDNLTADTSSRNSGRGDNGSPTPPTTSTDPSLPASWEATIDTVPGTYRFLGHTNRNQPYSFHPGTINIALCDGSGQTLSETVDLSVFLNLMLRDDGQVVGEY